MNNVSTLDLSRIAQDLQIRKSQVDNVVQLLDEGNTIPFITRYRKERTGGLNEEVLRQIQARITYQRQLADRKQTILKSIEGQGKLTAELRDAIVAADTSKRLEDLYLPYKPKKKSLASAAREKGLQPLALAVWNRDPAIANLAQSWTSFVNPEKELTTAEDVRAGVQHILAEMTAETAELRAVTRSLLWQTGKICSCKNEKVPDGQGLEYKDYFDFKEPLRHIPPHRILALNRGEKETVLKTLLDFDAQLIKNSALKALADSLLKACTPPSAAGTETPPTVTPSVGEAESEGEGEQFSPDCPYRTPHAEFLRIVLDDALGRLVLPSLEREIRRELTDEAEVHAVMIFARNLRSLLLQPPLLGRRVLAIDPGFRTGCKVVALDEHGAFLEDAVVRPHANRDREKKHKEQPAAGVTATAAETAPPGEFGAAPIYVSAIAPLVSPAPPPGEAPAAAPPAKSQPALRREEAKTKLQDLVTRHQLNVVAIGNGTACRETEEFISELIAEKLPDLAYVIVNEAGASVYSASAIGREEFPNQDATVRGTVSIGRRLQDPLSELVKVDPQSIGVGLYQHDVHPRHLKQSLDTIIESCVNQVGVNLNTASVPLLRHVSGFNQMVARDIIEFRKQQGAFKSREQLLQVPNIGSARYIQAAGFLKIPNSENPLDRTWIHPESYGVAAALLSELGFGPEALDDKARQEELREKLKGVSLEETAIRLQVGVPTLRDILDNLARPGRDLREDLPPPVFKKGILRIEDLQPGMEMKGTVLNVVDFGAFVDIGLKDSGLVHISQLANRYIKSPYDVVGVSDVVTVWVLNVDLQRHRVSLTMIKPGSERRPPEKHSHAPRPSQAAEGQRDERPQRGGGQGSQGGRRPEQRGARSGGPPQRRGRGPRPGQPPGQAAAAQAGEGATTSNAGGRPKPPPPPPPPPRKPRREAPRPKLSQAALEGKAPLRTFAELGAMFAAKHAPPPPPAPVADVKPPVEPVAEPQPVEQQASGEPLVTTDSATPPS